MGGCVRGPTIAKGSVGFNAVDSERNKEIGRCPRKTPPIKTALGPTGHRSGDGRRGGSDLKTVPKNTFPDHFETLCPNLIGIRLLSSHYWF